MIALAPYLIEILKIFILYCYEQEGLAYNRINKII